MSDTHPRFIDSLTRALLPGLLLCLTIAPMMSRAQGEPTPVIDPAEVISAGMCILGNRLVRINNP